MLAKRTYDGLKADGKAGDKPCLMNINITTKKEKLEKEHVRRLRLILNTR
jgi:hypothetical protein